MGPTETLKETPQPSAACAPNMRAVAARAKVSHQTVSRVLNGNPHVSGPVRRRVEEAIKDLGYRPNVSARSLRTRRSGTLGVLVHELTKYGPSQTLLGFERAARKAGYFISIAVVQDLHGSELQAAVAHLENHAVEGIAVIVPHLGAVDKSGIAQASVPVVLAGSHPAPNMAGTRDDQRLGARKAVRHLIDLGHTRIAHISGPLCRYDAVQRLEGWREALEGGGLATDLLFPGDWTAEHGYASGIRIAALPGLSAVFAANDQIALGVLRGVHERGIRVPEDFSIVGFDDQPDAAYFSPPLTTVSLDFLEQGHRCLELLTSRIEHRAYTTLAAVDPELVIRGSTRRFG